MTTDAALNLAAPAAPSVATSIAPEASFSARARVPRRIRPCRCRRFCLQPRQRNVAGISPPGQPEPFPPWRRQHVALVAAEIDEIDAFALEPLHQPAAVLGDGTRQILARKALAAGFDPAEQLVLVRPYVGEIDMERAVCVARIAEVFFFLALLQDDHALAELRGAVGGDEAGDAGPDHNHVVLDVGFGHRARVRVNLS